MTARGRHVAGVTLYRPDPVTFARHRAANDRRAMRERLARRRRFERYAVRFAISCDAEPDDATLAAVLSRCVRVPRPAEYPAIRAAVADYRAGLIPFTAPHNALAAEYERCWQVNGW